MSSRNSELEEAISLSKIYSPERADSLERERRERILKANGLLMESSVLRGIQPIAKSKSTIFRPGFEPGRIMVSWGYGWGLPGHGEAYSDCGSWRSKGCLNVEEHNQEGLFEEMSGKVYVKMFKRSCVRAECPMCYESWAGKEASKIEWRLEAWTKGKVVHVVVSPSKKDIEMLSYEELRRKTYVILRKSGIYGGSVIFHPFRENDDSTWYFSPHFHALGYGWVHGTKEGYERHGWIVRNVGIRKTVSGTALYQLSHAGVHEKYHTITWFGKLAYNNLKVPPRPVEKEVCPICGQELRDLWYFGGLDLPEEEGFYWLDPEGWRYKPKRFSGG